MMSLIQGKKQHLGLLLLLCISTHVPISCAHNAAELDRVDDDLPYSESQRVFEGVEKKLVFDVSFTPRENGKRHSLRDISRTSWSQLLEHAKCSIVSVKSNKDFDAYVLSESSMFVYNTKVVMKTCGTTALISAVTPFILLASKLNAEVKSVAFSRTNYEFPAAQDFPHESFDQEVTVLNEIFRGTPYILGEYQGPRFHLYLAQAQDALESAPEKTLELQMYKLDRSVMRQFYKESDDTMTGHDQTLNSGIDTLIPHSIIDDLAFEPCGYSMNGLLDRAYWTIHITPETNFSFVSFETNLVQESYDDLIHKVVDLFKPGVFSIAITEKGVVLTDPDLTDRSQAGQGVFAHRMYARKQSNVLTVGDGRRVSFSVHQSVKEASVHGSGGGAPQSIVLAHHRAQMGKGAGGYGLGDIPACASSKCSGPPLVDTVEK